MCSQKKGHTGHFWEAMSVSGCPASSETLVVSSFSIE